MNTFMGASGFNWFTGVVESINDPLKIGRVQVRIFGIHTEKLVLDESAGEGIPRENLPWAIPMQPVTSSAISGKGSTPLGMYQGTHVVGFARDGAMYQDLVIMGTIAGIPKYTSNITEGFNDPTGKYPLADHLNEPDLNRLSRNDADKKHPNLKLRTDTKIIDVLNSKGEKWSEPDSTYATVYPHNKVTETESGHLFEIDDTPNAERIHNKHKSGTFQEINADGTTVTKIVKDNYEFILGDDYINIKGNMQANIEKNLDVYVKGNIDLKVDGNVTQTVKGDVTELVEGNVTQTVKKNVTQNVEGNVTQTVKGNIQQDITGNLTTNAKQVTVTAPSGMTINADVNITKSLKVSTTINAGGNITSGGDVISSKTTLNNHTHSYTAPAHGAGPANTSPSQ